MSATNNPKISIVFVDDEPSILSALRRELHAWDAGHGVEIKTVSSGAEALALLEREAESVAIVVSDLKMPQMLGSDLLLMVRDRYPEIVTMLLTGYSETTEVMKAVKAGIYSYILKPWEPDYLKGELEKALDNRSIKLELKAQRARVEEELRWAGEMQRAILKPNLRSTKGIEVRVSYRPVPELFCGGDYYDVINLPGGKFLLLLGDVSGHGIKGAFITGIMKAIIYPEYIRTLQTTAFSPGAFLSWLNGRLHFELRSAAGLFVTMFAGIIDPDAKRLVYANAGHNEPYILTAWNKSKLQKGGAPLGVGPDQKYEDHGVELRQGDHILAYTDGLVECGVADGAADVDIDQLLSLELPGADYHRRLIGAALSMAGRKDFSDDLTIITVLIQ